MSIAEGFGSVSELQEQVRTLREELDHYKSTESVAYQYWQQRALMAERILARTEDCAEWNAAIEAAANEADHWQSRSGSGHACGQYIAGAIRGLKRAAMQDARTEAGADGVVASKPASDLARQQHERYLNSKEGLLWRQTVALEKIARDRTHPQDASAKAWDALRRIEEIGKHPEGHYAAGEHEFCGSHHAECIAIARAALAALPSPPKEKEE